MSNSYFSLSTFHRNGLSPEGLSNQMVRNLLYTD